jgi:hypothetical protein
MTLAIIFLVVGTFALIHGLAVLWMTTVKCFWAGVTKGSIKITGPANYAQFTWVVVGPVLLVLGFHYLP